MKILFERISLETLIKLLSFINEDSKASKKAYGESTVKILGIEVAPNPQFFSGTLEITNNDKGSLLTHKRIGEILGLK